MKHLLFLLVSLHLHNIILSCPEVCRCYALRKQVNCNRKALRRIPYGIPQDTEKLLLQDNLLTGGPALERSLSTLKSLKVLYLMGNKLTSFPQNLPPSLTQVSLDSNNIKFVGKRSIQNLKLLETLSLKNNNISSGVGLSTDAFIGADNLQTLSLSGNSLTTVPTGLPKNLRKLYLQDNKISAISFGSLQNLQYLEDFVIGNNSITNENIHRGSFLQLNSLTHLDMSHNQLTDVPADLPSYVEKLRLSHNKIQYLYSQSSPYHNTLVGLPLTQLDLSNNHLKSVEPGALSNINPFIQLQENPWQCDCHLKYLKAWLNNTTAVLTGEGRIKCDTPNALQGVTLSSLDMEALVCRDVNYRQSIQFSNYKPNSVTVRWRRVNTDTPNFVSINFLYGKLRCQNCTFKYGNEMFGEVEKVINWISDYDVIKLTDSLEDLPNKEITMDNLESGVRYVVCASDSSQEVKDIANGQCKLVMLTSKPPVVIPDGAIPVPSLSIILITVVSALFVLIIIVAALIVRHYVKARNEKRILKNRANATPFPTELIDQVLQRNTSQSQPYPRMDLTVPSQFRDNNFAQERHHPRAANTMNGRQEYGVTLVYNGQPQHLGHSGSNSPEGSQLLTERNGVSRNSNIVHNHDHLLDEEVARYHDDYYTQQHETVPMATYLEKQGSQNSTPHSRDTGVFV